MTFARAGRVEVGGGAWARSFVACTASCALVIGCGADGPKPFSGTDTEEGAPTSGTGNPATEEPGGEGSPGGGGGGAVGAETGGSASTSGQGTAECNPGPGRVVLQRLTRDEYDNTVADLFGISIAPARSFPPDSATSGFDNNARSLTISPQLAELLLDAATDVVAEAMATAPRRILTCDPTSSSEDACARSILEEQARRTFRRPATADEVDSVMLVFDEARAEGEGFERAVEHGLSALLVSPQFLFRGLPSADAPPILDESGHEILDDYALATRLSYFLWRSTPDDALLDRAAQGLGDDELRAEFERLLSGARASSLFDSFLANWLSLGKLSAASPDAATFPEFDEQLRLDMSEEVRRFFDDMRVRDGSALELLTSNRTFVTNKLANVYEIDDVSGSEFVGVDLDPTQRAGVLTMPAILTLTSDPDKTNIVKRGSWMAETILCAKPPPPPEGIPPLPDPMDGETERQRLDRHRTDPACAPCHDLIDPLGYPFESYGPLGRWRNEVDGAPVDTVGTLPDGRSFDDLRQMVDALSAGPEFGACLTEKLMIYALGRAFGGTERCRVEGIAEQNVHAEARLSDLLWAIVSSDAFQKRAVEAQP